MTNSKIDIVPIDIKTNINEKIEGLKKKTFNKFNVHVPSFHIRYDVYDPVILGMANYQLKIMRLHPMLLLEYGDKYVEEVVTHEFAHFAVAHMYPRGVNQDGKRVGAHGTEFNMVCVALGIVGSATTDTFIGSKALKKIEIEIETKKKQKNLLSAREHFELSYPRKPFFVRKIFLKFFEANPKITAIIILALKKTIIEMEHCIVFDNEPYTKKEMEELIDVVENGFMGLLPEFLGGLLFEVVASLATELYDNSRVKEAYECLEVLEELSDTQNF